DGVDLVRPHGIVVEGPAKESAVELLRGVRVGAGQLGPAECAWGMLRDRRHVSSLCRPGQRLPIASVPCLPAPSVLAACVSILRAFGPLGRASYFLKSRVCRVSIDV